MKIIDGIGFQDLTSLELGSVTKLVLDHFKGTDKQSQVKKIMLQSIDQSKQPEDWRRSFLTYIVSWTKDPKFILNLLKKHLKEKK